MNSRVDIGCAAWTSFARHALVVAPDDATVRTGELDLGVTQVRRVRVYVRVRVCACVCLQGAKEHRLDCMETLVAILVSGEARKQFAETAMNGRSSRAHTCVQLLLWQRQLST